MADGGLPQRHEQLRVAAGLPLSLFCTAPDAVARLLELYADNVATHRQV